jgi:hypothetical protein
MKLTAKNKCPETSHVPAVDFYDVVIRSVLKQRGGLILPMWAIAKEIAKDNFNRDIRMKQNMLHTTKVMQGSIPVFVDAQGKMTQDHNTLARSHIAAIMRGLMLLAGGVQQVYSTYIPAKSMADDRIEAIKSDIIFNG